MKKTNVMASLFLILILSIISVPLAVSGGFDEYGYNYQAMIFVGSADGVDRDLDGAVWGDPVYANDILVMKWSKAYSPYWREGGYEIWGQFEVIMDQGVYNGEHFWGALASPNGYNGF